MHRMPRHTDIINAIKWIIQDVTWRWFFSCATRVCSVCVAPFSAGQMLCRIHVICSRVVHAGRVCVCCARLAVSWTAWKSFSFHCAPAKMVKIPENCLWHMCISYASKLPLPSRPLGFRWILTIGRNISNQFFFFHAQLCRLCYFEH